MSSPSSTTRRWPRRLAIGAAVVIVLAVAIPFTYIHFFDNSSPAKLTLTPGSTGSGSGGTASLDGTTVAGTWTVQTGSVVGYRVQERLLGQNATAVGRTSSVVGTMVIKGGAVTSASFTAQMSTVKSNQSLRDKQFDGRIMDVAKYPTATFTLTSPITIGSVPAVGTIHSYPATGNLTLRGQTHPVHFTMHAERTSTGIEVQGDIPIPFATWGVPNPSFGSFVTTADHGTLEFLLDFGLGTANESTTTTPATTTPSSGSGGYPAPGAGGYGGGSYPAPGEGAPTGAPTGAPPGEGGGTGGPGISIAPGTTAPLSIGG